MGVRATNLLLALGVAACACADQRPEIELQNALSRCIEIESTKTYVSGQALFVTLAFKTVASTAECGCKSKLSAYTVYAKSDGYDSFMIEGKVLFQQSGKLELPLSTDTQIVADRPLLLSLSCAQPD